MALSSPDCLSSTSADDDHERGGKRIKLFGTWIQPTAVVRDASESGLEEENHGDGGESQLREEQELIELLEKELQEDEQARRLQQEGKHEYGDCMDGKEDGNYGTDQADNQHHHGAANYTVTDHAFLRSQRTLDRSTGSPWTVEKHRRFLEGLTAKGKSNWKTIAQDFVKTRNHMQLATHAQKCFLRQGAGPSVFNLAIETEQGDDGRAAAQGERRLKLQSPSSLSGLALSLTPPRSSVTPPKPRSFPPSSSPGLALSLSPPPSPATAPQPPSSPPSSPPELALSLAPPPSQPTAPQQRSSPPSSLLGLSLAPPPSPATAPQPRSSRSSSQPRRLARKVELPRPEGTSLRGTGVSPMPHLAHCPASHAALSFPHNVVMPRTSQRVAFSHRLPCPRHELQQLFPVASSSLRKDGDQKEETTVPSAAV